MHVIARRPHEDLFNLLAPKKKDAAWSGRGGSGEEMETVLVRGSLSVVRSWASSVADLMGRLLKI